MILLNFAFEHRFEKVRESQLARVVLKVFGEGSVTLVHTDLLL